MSAPGYWTVYADGASRGNPGPSAIGAVIYGAHGEPVGRLSQRVGHATNNEAEYRAAIAALEAALALGAAQIKLYMDSELVVRQLQGRYRLRNPRLRQLWNRMQQLRQRCAGFQVEHIPRQQNHLADALANRALNGVPLTPPDAAV